MRRWQHWGFLVGVTAVICGFLLPWTNHPTAGLRLIGLEFSEWAKFLPQVQEGSTPNRNFIYLPPIMVGAILALWTAFWPTRWQTWVMRGVALLVSLFSFPAIQVIIEEAQSEWIMRLGWCAAVGILCLFAGWLGRLLGRRGVWGLTAVFSLIGLILPTYAFRGIQPSIDHWLQGSVGTGIGLWLNGIGFGLILFVSIRSLRNNW